MIHLYKCSVAYRPWTFGQECSRLCSTLCTLAHLSYRQIVVRRLYVFIVIGLQLVVTPVKYDHNLIENVTTWS